MGKQSIKLSDETMKRIRMLNIAYKNSKGASSRVTNDDIVRLGIDKLMRELDVRTASTKEEVDKAIMLTNGLVKRAGIKIE